MKQALLLMFGLAVVPTMGSAATRCVTPSGDTIFTDMGCPSGSKRAGEIAYQSKPSSGLRPGERRMLNDIKARESRERESKRYARERDARNHVGYLDRKKIKSLEGRKRRLSGDLQRGKKTYGQSAAIRSEIRGIDRQIEQLRSPNW